MLTVSDVCRHDDRFLRALVSPKMARASIAEAASAGPKDATVDSVLLLSFDGSYFPSPQTNGDDDAIAVSSPRTALRPLRCALKSRLQQGIIQFMQSPPPILLNANGNMFMDWEANSERQGQDDVTSVLGDDLQVCL